MTNLVPSKRLEELLIRGDRNGSLWGSGPHELVAGVHIVTQDVMVDADTGAIAMFGQMAPPTRVNINDQTDPRFRMMAEVLGDVMAVMAVDLENARAEADRMENEIEALKGEIASKNAELEALRRK